MAAWDWYPYDQYCVQLAGDWLWGGSGPAANLANPGSTFNVKLAEAIYNAYRKGGFTFAESFKDCVVTRYGQALVDVGPGYAPDASSFAAAVSLKILVPIARAKADAEAEAITAGLKAGMQRVAKQTVSSEGMLRALYSAPSVPLQPIQPSPAGPFYPAESQLEMFENRSWGGYSYRAFPDAMAGYIAAELDMMDVDVDLVIDLGTQVSGKLLTFTAGSAGGGTADEWAAGARADGKGVLIGAIDSLPPDAVWVANPKEPKLGEAGLGYGVATRDISVIAKLCQADPAAAVLYEPKSGWVAPSADEAARGKEAGVGVPMWALYAVGGVALLGAGYYAYKLGKGS